MRLWEIMSEINRWRYTFILWLERSIVRVEYMIDLAHVEKERMRLYLGDGSYEAFARARIRYENKWQ